MSAKEQVFTALMSVYGRDESRNRTWWNARGYTADVAKALTVDILSLIVETYVSETDKPQAEYYRRTLSNEITNRIWMVFPGGTTAEYAAEKVCDALKLTTEKV